MKTKLLIIWALSFLVLCGVASAALTDGLIAYWTMDEAAVPVTDSIGNLHLGATGSPRFYAAGKINGAWGVYSGNLLNHTHLYTSPTTDSMLGRNNYCISFWAKWNNTGACGSSANGILGFGGGQYRNYTTLICASAANGAIWCGYPGDKDVDSGGNWTTTTNSTWEYYVVCRDNNNAATHNVLIYKNGALQSNATNTTTQAGVLSNITLGAYIDGSNANTKENIFDEIGIWNRTLTATEVATLYNGGSGTTYPFGIVTNFTVTAADEWNSSPTSNINATICNGATCYSYSNSTGERVTTIILTNSTLLWNVTVASTNYFNRTYLNQNVISGNLVAYLHQAELCLNATSKISGSYITPNNFTLNSRTVSSCFNLTAGTHNIHAQKTGWYSKNQTFTVAALDNVTRTVENMTSSVVNISVYQSNGTILSSYGLNITSTTYPSWTGELGSTTNGSYYFSGVNGTYLVQINSSIGNESFYFTITSTLHNVSYYFFSLTNCTPMSTVILNFTIRNEETEALLNDSDLNIWFNVTSGLYAGDRTFNLSYDTGNYYLVCIPNGSSTNFTAYAQMKYSNLVTYAEKNYYLVNYPLNNTYTQNINLYLTNGTTQTKLQVRDYADDGMSDVYIKVLSYDLGTNSYKTTEIVKTDNDGDTYAQIVLNTMWYAFILEQDGAIILQTLPTKITSSPRTFRITSGADYFNDYDVIHGLSSSLTYNNATTTFSFTYSDPTGAVQQGCVKLTKRSINGDTVLNTSCVTSTAATILMNITDVPGSNTYIADTYAIIDGETFSIDSLSVNFNTTYKKFGGSGILFSLLIIICLVMVGIWHPAVAIVMMIVGVVVTNIMGLFFMNWTYIITFIILGVLTMYRVSKSD